MKISEASAIISNRLEKGECTIKEATMMNNMIRRKERFGNKMSSRAQSKMRDCIIMGIDKAYGFDKHQQPTIKGNK